MTDLHTTPQTGRPAPLNPRSGPGAPRRRMPRRYLVVVVLAVLALVAGLVGPWAYGLYTDSSAKDRIEADPPPQLFPASQVQRVESLTGPQADRATRLLAGWWRDHGTGADDAAFTSWLESHFPRPPSRTARAQEMKEVERLDRERTDAGVKAATWLEDHGKKDIWKLEVHDQAEYLPASAGDARKNDVDAMLKMSKDVADTLGTKFQQSAPYVLEPSLRPDHHVSPGDVCPCSYPSRHAAAGAAARTFLAHFDPQRDSDYRWFQDQIDFSRIYMAGHVASDISGGTLLGDLIGDYFLVTRGGVSPDSLGT